MGEKTAPPGNESVTDILVDTEVSKLLRGVDSGDETEIGRAADAMKDRLFAIGEGISARLGKRATLAQFRKELRRENPSKIQDEEVRAGFNAHRERLGWKKL